MFTGTKPKVKRSLFKTTTKSHTPFSSDLPLISEQSNISRSSVNLSKPVATSATARRKAYVPSVHPYTTRNSKNIKLVKGVSNPESILRKKNISPWQKLRNKLENTPSLLTVVSNLVSGKSLRTSIAEIIKDTARTSNSTSPISRANLLSTAHECANTLLFPDRASNLLPDEHSGEFENPTYSEGATGGLDRPFLPRPEKQINHSLNESISKHRGSPVSSDIPFEAQFPLPESRDQSFTDTPTENNDIFQNPTISFDGTIRPLLFTPRPEPEKTNFHGFSPAHAQSNPTAVIPSDNPWSSADSQLIRDCFATLRNNALDAFDQQLHNKSFGLSPHTNFISESVSHPASVTGQIVSRRSVNVPNSIPSDCQQAFVPSIPSRESCGPENRAQSQPRGTSERNLVPAVPLAPICLADRERQQPIGAICKRRETTCSAQANLHPSQAKTATCPPSMGNNNQTTGEPNQFNISCDSDSHPFDPNQYIETFRNIENGESDSETEPTNKYSRDEFDPKRIRQLHLPKTVTASSPSRENKSKISNIYPSLIDQIEQESESINNGSRVKSGTKDIYSSKPFTDKPKISKINPSAGRMNNLSAPQMAEDAAAPAGNLNDYQKGQRALTMLIQLPNFSGGPATRFDRWIKLFENIVAMSNWSDDEKVNMLITKMTDRAHDILQNVLESYTVRYDNIKAILHERFHGSETEDYYQKKFDGSERKPQETVLDYAFRLKTIFQRAYPPVETKHALKRIRVIIFFVRNFFRASTHLLPVNCATRNLPNLKT